MVVMKFKDLTTVLDTMNKQRLKGTLCDVKIMVSGGQVYAHKPVLAAYSIYFHAMFTGGFREGELPMAVVNMSEVFPDINTAEHIIQSMYTGELDITPDNVCFLYSVCSFLLYDKTKLLCEDFMTENLWSDTCIDYWQASYYHTPTGDLYTATTDFLRSRFHDLFITQECVLNVPQSSVSGFLQSGITKFCSPLQILNFLMEWYLNSDLVDVGVLKQLVAEAGLPISCLDNGVDGIYNSLNMRCMKRHDSQFTSEIYEPQNATFQLGTDEMPENTMLQEMKKPSSHGQHRRKKEFNTDIDLKRERLSRNHPWKDEGESPVKVKNKEEERPHDHGTELNKEKPAVHCFVEPREGEMDQTMASSSNHHHGHGSQLRSSQLTDHLIPDCSYAIPSNDAIEDWRQEVSNSQLSDHNLEETEQVDVLLAFAPSFTGVLKNKNQYQRLRVCAYNPDVQLWVDLGTTDYPVRDDGIRSVNLHLYAAGRHAYFSTETDLFVMPLPCGEWKMVVLPKENGERKIHPLCVNNTLYLLIVQDVGQGVEIARVPYMQNLLYMFLFPSIQPEVQQKIVFGKITESGIWEEILHYKDNMDPSENALPSCCDYGPCWAENSCFLVQKWNRESNGREVLCFDPNIKEIRVIPFEGDSSAITETFARKTLSVLQDNWVYLWKKLRYSSDTPAFTVKCQTSEDRSCQLERQNITYPSYANGKLFLSASPNVEIPENYSLYASTGSRFWCLKSTSHTSSFLHELFIHSPDVVREHPPPPCNVMVTVTGARLDSCVLINKPSSRYQHVQNVHHSSGVLLGWADVYKLDSDIAQYSDEDSDGGDNREWDDDDDDDDDRELDHSDDSDHGENNDHDNDRDHGDD